LGNPLRAFEKQRANAAKVDTSRLPAPTEILGGKQTGLHRFTPASHWKHSRDQPEINVLCKFCKHRNTAELGVLSSPDDIEHKDCMKRYHR